MKTYQITWLFKITILLITLVATVTGCGPRSTATPDTRSTPINTTAPTRVVTPASTLRPTAILTRIPPECEPETGWIPFSEMANAGEAPRAYIKDQTTMDTMVNFDIPGMYVHNVDVSGTIFQRLSIPDYTTSQALGEPEVPIVGRMIEVPYGIDFELEIVAAESIMLDCYNVYPAQVPAIRQIEPVETEFTLNDRIYETDNFYPGALSAIQAEDIGVIRGHRVVFLKVNPVQFNPVSGLIEAYSNIEVRLNYSQPAQIEAVDTRLLSDDFETLLQSSLANYVDPSRLGTETDTEDQQEQQDGYDYLIITHGDFYDPDDLNNPIVRLRDWRQHTGLRTIVVNVDDIINGDPAADIRDYIQDAYDYWSPAPTYVLLVGDAEFIPTNYQTPHPDCHNGSLIGTDLPYVTVDGSDYFPDMYIGRLPVDTLAQAEDVIDKILKYEQTPPEDENFYQNVPLVQLFEDVSPITSPTASGNGQEDGTFRIIEFAEAIHTFMDSQGYNPERIYDQSGTWVNGPERYENGAPIPVGLTLNGDPAAGIAGFPWNGNTGDISTAIDTGSFVIAYDGHGGRTSWSRPRFDTADADALGNGDFTPVVFSLACMTGWFDNETNPTGTDENCHAPVIAPAVGQESLSEHLLRHDSGGAVAVIASTRVSWDPNDFMMLGMFKAIWPNFDPNPPLSGGALPHFPATSPLYRMGQINTFSKIYIAQRYTHNAYREASFEMYTLFGDPAMPIWTEAPGDLDVLHPPGIGSIGAQSFVVNVTDANNDRPVHNARVVLTRGNAVLAISETNPDGIVQFSLSNIGTGDLDITVIAHNYRPYEGSLDVTDGGAILNRLDPDNGVENQTFLIGGLGFVGDERVDVYFDEQILATTMTTNGEFGQVGVSDIDVDVPASYPLGPVNIFAHGLSSDRYGVDIFFVRTENPIDLYTYSQWDSTTWHLHTSNNPIWDNPELQLYNLSGNPVGSNNLEVGESYAVELAVHNDTAFDAERVAVTFKWANFGIGQPDRVWNEIETVVVDVPAHSIIPAEVEWAPPTTGHLCIKAEIYHIEDINADNNYGQENTHVGPATSPAVIPFLIYNPSEYPVVTYLELRQLGSEEQEPLWGAWVGHPEPQIIEPGDIVEASVSIDPDLANVDEGAQAEFVLTAFMDGRVVGGLNFTITKE